MPDDNNSYDELHFTDCYLGAPEITEQKITVSIRNLGVFPGHPLNQSTSMLWVPNCRLVFEGVQKSTRTITEYKSDPTQDAFRSPYTLNDGPFQYVITNSQKDYRLEGISETPLAWVDWCIVAVSYHLEFITPGAPQTRTSVS